MTTLDSSLCGALKAIGPLMQAADDRRSLSPTHPKRAVERDLKSALRTVVGPLAAAAGLRLDDVERTIAPIEWPRVGPVDLIFLDHHLNASNGEGRAAFVELKWAYTDVLWYVAWDLAKSALVARLGLAERALCVVGTLDSERTTRYGALLAETQRDTAQFLRDFHDALKPFCFPEPGREHPTGPYSLPAVMETAVLCEHPLLVRSLPWTLVVLEVSAPGSEWVAVDERGRPRPSPDGPNV
jgi:hypothetical protein